VVVVQVAPGAAVRDVMRTPTFERGVVGSPTLQLPSSTAQPTLPLM
jgi:hypothetical protein